jgi:ParB-like chromosome segregation protein Spo0J
MDAHFGGRMKKLELSLIRLDGDTQARAELNQSTVDLYAEQIQEGDKFPPITVFFDGSDHWLADGFHRFFAHQKASIETIEADVINGTLRDAKLHAYKANGKRGLQLSAADIRRIIKLMLQDEEWSGWSNKAIAAHVGCSDSTVSRVRAETGAVSAVKYVDKHGNEKVMDVSRIKDAKALKISRLEPEPVDEPFVEPVEEEDERDSKIQELVDTIVQLEEENAKLRDVIATQQWDASEFEKMDIEQTVADLRNELKLKTIALDAVTQSRDMFQNRYAEAVKEIKSLQNKLKKAA